MVFFIRRTEARAPSKPNFDKTLKTILRFFDDKIIHKGILEVIGLEIGKGLDIPL